MLTLAGLHLGLGGTYAFTVVSSAYLIFILLQRRYGLILIAQLVQVGSYLLPGVVALPYFAAQHGEVVYQVAIGIPSQYHAALAGLRHQRLVYLTIAGMIEVGQCWLGERIILRLIHRCGNRIDGVVLLLPTAAKFSQQVVQRGLRNYRRHHLRHGLASNNLPVVGTHRFHNILS